MSLSPQTSRTRRQQTQFSPEVDLAGLLQSSNMNPLVLGGGVSDLTGSKVGDNQMLQQLLMHPSTRSLFGL